MCVCVFELCMCACLRVCACESIWVVVHTSQWRPEIATSDAFLTLSPLRIQRQGCLREAAAHWLSQCSWPYWFCLQSTGNPVSSLHPSGVYKDSEVLVWCIKLFTHQVISSAPALLFGKNFRGVALLAVALPLRVKMRVSGEREGWKAAGMVHI